MRMGPWRIPAPSWQERSSARRSVERGAGSCGIGSAQSVEAGSVSDLAGRVGDLDPLAKYYLARVSFSSSRAGAFADVLGAAFLDVDLQFRRVFDIFRLRARATIFFLESGAVLSRGQRTYLGALRWEWSSR